MAGGTVFFARLRTSPVKFERGMCNFFFGMEKPEFCFCMSYLKAKYKPNETKPTVDVQIQSCEALQSCGTQIFVFSRITGERETPFDETLQ